MIINITYDASVNSCPHEAAFKACVAGVVRFYETQFTNSMTINWDIGWGEVDGSAIAGGSGAESVSNYTNNAYSYAQIRSALAAHATSADDKTAVASLLAADPTRGGTFSMTNGEAKALGFLNANAGGIDGWSGLDTTSAWVFNTTNTNGANVPNGGSDAFSFLAHELSEVMGRQMNFGAGSGDGVAGDGYYPYDLFDYRAGVRSFQPAAADRYFSIDRGKTNTGQHYFNNDGNAGDLFDTLPNAIADSFDYAGSAGLVSGADLRLMDILGYNPTPNFTWASATNGAFGAAADWTADVTPGTANNAILNAPGNKKYTVTSSTSETVGSVQTSATATLAVTGGVFKAVSGTGGFIGAGGASAGVISVAAGATFEATGAFVNAGALVSAGLLEITAAVSGAGTVSIGGGRADFASTFSQNVAFTAAACELELAKSTTYGGTISGFSKTGGTSLDLQDIAFASASGGYNGTTASGVLTITDGTRTDHIKFAGNYTAAGSGFSLSNDAGTGTVVTFIAGAAAQGGGTLARQGFVEAMAGFGASVAAPAAAAAESWRAPASPLVSPRIQFA